MIERQLIDENDDRSYFVYLTNRNERLRMFQKEVNQIFDEMNNIQMGYTDLWIYERVAIYKDEKWITFSNNDDAANKGYDFGRVKEEKYRTFFFFESIRPSTNELYMPDEETMIHDSNKKALEHMESRMNYFKSHYPNRGVYGMCAKHLYDFMWH
ncbi:hypothetical protein [Virgibacillus necropolis]|uniref:Uncharacterized protein n=1 Tax=Virgibacillus necropolis TaxID=163877 RepID=A0A221MCN0_9BACI|nr:hypothetical protein [Virgibacillus necropolis]ASN05370.1 hypothetical protein CFK40_10270 [Virgibacillus necropolis]